MHPPNTITCQYETGRKSLDSLPVAFRIVGHVSFGKGPLAHDLLDDVLDDRLVKNRQHLLGRHLGAPQEAGAQAGGWDVLFHVALLSSKNELCLLTSRRLRAKNSQLP